MWTTKPSPDMGSCCDCLLIVSNLFWLLRNTCKYEAFKETVKFCCNKVVSCTDLYYYIMFGRSCGMGGIQVSTACGTVGIFPLKIIDRRAINRTHHALKAWILAPRLRAHERLSPGPLSVLTITSGLSFVGRTHSYDGPMQRNNCFATSSCHWSWDIVHRVCHECARVTRLTAVCYPTALTCALLVNPSLHYYSTGRVTEKGRADCGSRRSPDWKRVHCGWTRRTAGSTGSECRDCDTSCGGNGGRSGKSANRDRCHQHQERVLSSSTKRKRHYFVLLQVRETQHGGTVTRDEVGSRVLRLLSFYEELLVFQNGRFFIFVAQNNHF